MALSMRSAHIARPAGSRRVSVCVRAATWQKATTTDAVKAAGGKLVVELAGQKVLLVEDAGALYAVSNKCSHLNLPLVGKTAMFQAEISQNCVICPAHKTAFDLKTGEVKGEWCPGFPNLPLVGKVGGPKPLPTFDSRVDAAGNVEVLV